MRRGCRTWTHELIYCNCVSPARSQGHGGSAKEKREEEEESNNNLSPPIQKLLQVEAKMWTPDEHNNNTSREQQVGR